MITVISGGAEFSRKAQKGAFFVLLHRKDFIEKIVLHVIDIAGSVEISLYESGCSGERR